MKKNVSFTIITGLSGAGKSQAIRSFEDLGFFCVDNLPPLLIPKFAELAIQSDGKINKIALVIDSRGGKFFKDVFQALEELEEIGIKHSILFLDASDEVLVRRFKETRRRHPLAREGLIIEAIRQERKILSRLKEKAQKIIDTSGFTAQELKTEIKSFFSENDEWDKLVATVMSFGFKYGIPVDSDLVLDVRFLPNPYYVEELREFSGNEKVIDDYILSWDVTKEFFSRLFSLVEFLLPHYVSEGKTSLTIAIGCTGGRHRSVVVANKLGNFIKEKGYSTLLKHRDIKKS